jgi:Concanavalin A-like lectin/glucanases superfamily
MKLSIILPIAILLVIIAGYFLYKKYSIPLIDQHLINFYPSTTTVQNGFAFDRATGSYNGALVGNAEVVNDPMFGSTFQFNESSSQFLQLPPFTMSPEYKGLSFSCWFNVNQPPKQWARLFDMSQDIKAGGGGFKNAKTGAVYSYVLGFNSNGTIFVGGGGCMCAGEVAGTSYCSKCQNGQGWTNHTVTQNVCDGKWHHIAWILSANKWRLFLDGAEISPIGTNPALLPPSDSIINTQSGSSYVDYPYVYVGHSTWEHDPNISAKISDVRFYAKEISEVDVKDIISLVRF